MKTSDLEKMIIRHEGKRHLPYECAAGKITIGVGRNLDDMGLSEDEIMYLLRNDISRCEAELDTYPWFRKLDQVRRDACIDLCFNMGLTRLLRFRKMIDGLDRREWDYAADELLDSRYKDQVGKRATEISEMIRTGKYQ
jgi:lysozyme